MWFGKSVHALPFTQPVPEPPPAVALRVAAAGRTGPKRETRWSRGRLPQAPGPPVILSQEPVRAAPVNINLPLKDSSWFPE
jgi:hypothetical protein